MFQHYCWGNDLTQGVRAPNNPSSTIVKNNNQKSKTLLATEATAGVDAAYRPGLLLLLQPFLFSPCGIGTTPSTRFYATKRGKKKRKGKKGKHHKIRGKSSPAPWVLEDYYELGSTKDTSSKENDDTLLDDMDDGNINDDNDDDDDNYYDDSNQSQLQRCAIGILQTNATIRANLGAFLRPGPITEHSSTQKYRDGRTRSTIQYVFAVNGAHGRANARIIIEDNDDDENDGSVEVVLFSGQTLTMNLNPYASSTSTGTTTPSTTTTSMVGEKAVVVETQPANRLYDGEETGQERRSRSRKE